MVGRCREIATSGVFATAAWLCHFAKSRCSLGFDRRPVDHDVAKASGRIKFGPNHYTVPMGDHLEVTHPGARPYFRMLAGVEADGILPESSLPGIELARNRACPESSLPGIEVESVLVWGARMGHTPINRRFPRRGLWNWYRKVSTNLDGRRGRFPAQRRLESAFCPEVGFCHDIGPTTTHGTDARQRSSGARSLASG